jgi:hypothetical protein
MVVHTHINDFTAHGWHGRVDPQLVEQRALVVELHELERERRQVGPEYASWPMRPYGDTAVRG